MKKALKITFAVLLGLNFLTTSAFAQEQFSRSGFLGNPSVYDLLQKVSGDDLDVYRWVKPGVDPKKYNKFMVDSVIFFLADKSDYKGIDPQEMKALCDEFNKQLVVAFKDKLPIVADPGPDVLRIRTAITNVQPSRPGASAITSIVPIGLGVSLVKKGATGGWVGSGETATEIIFQDSVTNEVVAMGATHRAAAFDERFSKWGSAYDSFKFWSERVAQAIINYKTGKMLPLAK